MTGLGKRAAEYVPRVCRTELENLSKAALMEIAFDLALRCGGEGNEQDAYREIVNTEIVLAQNFGRKPTRLAPDFRAIAKARLASIANYWGVDYTSDDVDFWKPYANGAE